MKIQGPPHFGVQRTAAPDDTRKPQSFLEHPERYSPFDGRAIVSSGPKRRP